MKKKNFRLEDEAVAKLAACMDDLGLTSETMAVKVAIEHLYATREGLNITDYLILMRQYAHTSTTQV